MPFQVDKKPFQSDIPETPQVAPDFGKRFDGTPKGLGFFGPLQRPDGDISTELSIGVGFDGKETEIPLLVPTLDQQEIDVLLGGGEVTQQITNKAVSHARQRIGQGLSPFAQEGEQSAGLEGKSIAEIAQIEQQRESSRVSIPEQLGFEEAPVTRQKELEAERKQVAAQGRTLFEEAKVSLKKGGLNVVAGLGGTLEELARLADKPILNQLGDVGAEFALSARNELRDPQLTATDTAGKTPTQKTGLFIARVVPETLSFMVGTVAATVLGGPGAGAVFAFSVEGENAFQDAIAGGATREEANIDRLIVGTINAALEQMQVNRVLKFGENGLQSIAKIARDRTFAAIRKAGKEVTLAGLKQFITEGLQEATQEFVSIATPAVREGELPDIDQALRQIGEAGLAGGVSGLVLGGGASGVNALSASLDSKTQLAEIAETKPDIVKAAKEPPVAPIQPAKPITPTKPTPTAIKPAAKPVVAPTKQIEVSDTEAAALLGESLEKIKANVTLKERLSKELIITEFQPSDFVPKAKKGPGLTRAEQQIVTPEVQGELRFAQTQGLPVGFKAGQKEANDIAKRRLDDFRTIRKVEKVALQDARKLVTEYAKDPVVAKKLITSLAKVDSPAKMAAFADKIGEFVKEAERKQAITSYKTTFNKLKKDNRLGKIAFGKLRGAARGRILKFADTIDLKKLSVAKKAELETLMGKVKDLGVDLSEGVRQLDVDTRDALNQLDPLIDSLDRLSKTPVSDMGLEEIRTAEDTLKYIVRQNEIENKQIFGKRLVELAKTETKAVVEVSVSKKQRKIFKKEAKKGIVAKAKRPGVFAILKRGTVGQSRTVPTLVQVSTVKGATATKDILDTKIWDGFREANRTQFESVDFLKKQYAKHNITTKTLDSFDKEFKVVIGSKSRVVTADDLGGIEMHLRSLENIEQLRKTEGIWLQGKKVTGFTIKELVNAVEKLTPSQLKMLDIANLQNRTITAPAINEEFLNLWGYEPATNPNYWAMVRRFKKRVGGAFGINFSRAIEQQSSFQPRTGGTKPIVVVPFRQQMWHSIQVGARSRTAIAFHNARTLLNSDKWQNAMIDAGRENEMNDIIKIFERTQGLSSDKDVLEMAGQTLMSNLAKSKLRLRPSTPLVQVASFPVSFSEINPKYAVPLKGYKAQTGKAQEARLKKFSPTLRLRFDGGRITPEVGNISASEGFKSLVFDKPGLTLKPLASLKKMDKNTIQAIDIMVQRMIRNTTNLKGDTFWEAVSLKTEETTRLTQPMWDHFARSVLLTNPNFFLRATIPFRAPREAMLNVSIRGRDSLAKGDKKQFAKSFGAVGSSILMARLIKLGIGALTTAFFGILIKGRVPKRRKDLSDFVTDITTDAVGILPFAGDVLAPAIEFAVEGKTFRQAELNNLLGDYVKVAGEVAFDLTKSGVQLANGDTKKAGESVRKAFFGATQVALERKGLPFTGPRDIIKPALKEEPAGTFGRTRQTRTQPTRTAPTRTKPTRTFGRER